MLACISSLDKVISLFPFVIEDFTAIESKLIVFGENNTSAKKLEEIYRVHSKCICTDYIYTDAIAASFLILLSDTYFALPAVSARTFSTKLFFLMKFEH